MRAICVAIVALLVVFPAAGDSTCPTDLSALVKGGRGWKVVNRSVTWLNQAEKRVHFDERAGQGIARLTHCRFGNGSIEFDARGKDVFQRSFIGVAFHGRDDVTFDAIYFRPFNFVAADPVRHAHAVQYIAEPSFGWQRLRAEFPGRYEQPIRREIEPEEWFHVRVVVQAPMVRVFVNGATEPTLAVKQLSNRRIGWVGLWVGEGSGGDFANLRIVKTD